MKGKISQRSAVILIIVIAAVIVAVATGYALKPAEVTPGETTTITTTAPGTTTTTTAPGTTITTTAPPTTTTTPQEETITLRFWHSYGSTELAEAENLVAEWNGAHPNIQVEMEYVPSDMLFQKMVTLLAAGQVPCDIARYDIALTPQLADMGVVLEISDLAEESGISENDFYPGPWSSCVWEGGLYGVPLDTCCTILYYRKDLLEAENLAVPTTWDELRSAAMKLTKDLNGDGVTDQWGFEGPGGYEMWNFNPFLWQAGGDVLSSDMNTVIINNTKAIQALQFLLDLVYVDNASPPPDLWKWSTEALSKGEVAMGIDGPWGWACARDIFGLDVDTKLGVATFPAGPAGGASVIGGQNLVIPKFTEHPREAMEFVKYLTSYYYQSEMMNVGVFPVLKAASQAEVIASNPLWATIAEQMETARSRPPHPKYAEMNNILKTYLEEAFRQQKTAEAALDAIATEIQGLLP